MFTAVTFNMQNGEPWLPGGEEPAREDIARTIGFLREADADILLLQEVERGRDGGGQTEPPPNFTALRAGLPGYEAVFAYPPDNPDELPFGIGLAIFSRYPIEGFWREALPAAPVPFEFGGRQRMPSQRLVIGCTALIEGRRVALLNTHLQAFFMIGASAAEHPGQLARIAELVASAGPCGILGGDFNCAPGDPHVAKLASVGYRSAQTGLPTWKRRPYAVDHLFFGDGLRLAEARVLPTDASDHDAVRAVFEFAR